MVMLFFGSTLADALFRPIRQTINRTLPSEIPAPAELVAARRNRSIDADTFFALMRLHGYGDAQATHVYQAAGQVLPETVAIAALRRHLIDPSSYEELMAQGGWNHDQAQMFLNVTQFIPSPADIVTWLAKEVFEPRSVQRYGLLEEFGEVQESPGYDLFAQQGIGDGQAQNYWIAHWQHPSWTEIRRFLHRGELTPGEVQDWFRLVEIPPFWRQMFTRTAYEPYTRVDIRRMWDLGVVGDEEVVKTYQDEGYDEAHARNLLTFTKVERQLPELRQRFKNGWIGIEDVRQELLEIGLRPDRVSRIIQRIDKADKPERVQQERDLTKAEVVRAVRRGRIPPETGLQMLARLGYDRFEAEVLLEINPITLESSPETPLEHWKLVELLCRAAGTPCPPIPPELLDAEKGFHRAIRTYNDALEKDKEVAELNHLRYLAGVAESRYRSLARVNGWDPGPPVVIHPRAEPPPPPPSC